MKCKHCGDELRPHPHPQAGGILINQDGPTCLARWPMGDHEPDEEPQDVPR